MCYETMLARHGLDVPSKPRGAAPIRPPPTSRSALSATGTAMMERIDFFKTRQPEFVMRSLREVFFRADLDGREATLMRAIALEVVKYIERRGVP
jgi:tRNA C32,U32 (ribose-2'-O)-methylase TrmJ